MDKFWKSHHTHKNRQLHDVIDILANTTMVIILRYTKVSNQHIAHLKCSHMSIISHFKKIGEKYSAWKLS